MSLAIGESATEPNHSRDSPTGVSVAAIAWVALSLLFIGIRIAPVFYARVAGVELVHLSAAWDASLGLENPAFAPSLFQAATSYLFGFTDSEIPARLIALAFTATIPLALYLLRHSLGQPGALAALLLLTFDGPGLALGSSASALALDGAVVAWLLVLALRPDFPWWSWAIAAFAATVSGPLVLPLAIAILVTRAAGRGPLLTRSSIAALAGVILGVLGASFAFGRGWEGLTVPPLDLFTDSLDQTWSTATTAELTVLYAMPFLALALTALAFTAPRLWRQRLESPEALLAPLWLLIALAWFVVALASESPAAVAAITMPAAIVGGPVLISGIAAMVGASWRLPAVLLTAAALVSGIVLYVLGEWAREDQAGSSTEQLLAGILGIIILASLAAVASGRKTAPAVVAPVLALGAIFLLVGSIGIADSARHEPFRSPVESPDTAELTRVIEEALDTSPGLVAVHPSLADGATWPLRTLDDGYVITTAVPPDATVAIWPENAVAPDGLTPAQGRWSFVTTFQPPDTALRWLRWLGDRNTLQTRPEHFALYTEASP